MRILDWVTKIGTVLCILLFAINFANGQNDTVYVYNQLLQTPTKAEIRTFVWGPEAYEDSLLTMQFPIGFKGGVPSGVQYHNNLSEQFLLVSIIPEQLGFSWFDPQIEMFETSPTEPVLTIEFDKMGVDSVWFGNSGLITVEFSTITARNNAAPVIVAEALPWKEVVNAGESLRDYIPLQPVSVGIVEDEVLLKVFPNPTTGTISFDVSNVPSEIVIHDIMGNVVYEGEYREQFTFDYPGTYIITIEGYAVKVFVIK